MITRQRWTTEDIQDLKEALKQEDGIEAVAKRLQRTPKAIRAYCEKHNISSSTKNHQAHLPAALGRPLTREQLLAQTTSFLVLAKYAGRNRKLQKHVQNIRQRLEGEIHSLPKPLRQRFQRAIPFLPQKRAA